MRDLILFDLDQTLIDSRPVAALRRQRRWYAVYERIPRLQAYDGVVALWNGLEVQGFSLGVVTSSPRPYCERLLDHLGLIPQVTVCYHDTASHKPHPAPLLKATRTAGRTPEQALYVGDTANDMRAALSAGLLDIGALWGAERRSLLRRVASRFYDAPEELKRDLTTRMDFRI